MSNSSSSMANTWNLESKSYGFDDILKPDYAAHLYYLTKLFGNVKNKNILEVGSGSGQSSAYLALKGANVSLLDISNESLDFSKKYFSSMKLEGTFYMRDIFKMKFPPESFDYVWNAGVIEHFSDINKIKIIKKMWYLVKPGGKLLITVPNLMDFPFIVAKKILQIRKRWSFGQEDDLTPIKLRRLVNEAGIKNNGKMFAYNPIVGWWFFPYGREITDFLKLNSVANHKKKSPFGHILVYSVRKPLTATK